MATITRSSILWCTLVAALPLAACDAAPSAAPPDSEKPHAAEPVVQTAPLAAAEIAPKIEGSAAIVSPTALIQLDADLRAAKIAADYSQALLARSQALFKSNATVSKQALETAERQADTDAVQLKLLESRLHADWGDEAPFLAPETRTDIVAKLSATTKNLVRIDLPAGIAGKPRNARLFPLGGGPSAAIETLWPAPSGNLAMPGESYFGLVDSAPGLRAGDRARFTAEAGQANTGVVIPNGAIVIEGGEAWCYIESDAKKFERKRVPLELPVEDGYLVREGFAPGERVVVRGAAMLLAREAAPDNEEETGSTEGTSP